MFFYWLCSVLLACVEPKTDGFLPMECNGHAHLCSLPLNEVAFAATHNSMANSQEEWIPPNQKYAIPQQLADGIRGLNLDTYMWQEEAYLCHGFCELGAKPLADSLREIEQFLEGNPHNVIVITFQASISAEDTLNAFAQANLQNRLYHYEVGETWPTLEQLISMNKQVVVFASNDGGRLDGYMAQWTHWLDNPYQAKYVEEFSCAPDRGDPQTATLYNVNHFISRPIALTDFAEEGNWNPILHDHVFSCWAETGRFPNQVLVDFYSIGDVFSVVDALNDRAEEK